MLLPVLLVSGRVRAPSLGTCVLIIAWVICLGHCNQTLVQIDQHGCDLFRLASALKIVSRLN